MTVVSIKNTTSEDLDEIERAVAGTRLDFNERSDRKAFEKFWERRREALAEPVARNLFSARSSATRYGTLQTVVFPGSGSDWRGPRNAVRDLRHALGLVGTKSARATTAKPRARRQRPNGKAHNDRTPTLVTDAQPGSWSTSSTSRLPLLKLAFSRGRMSQSQRYRDTPTCTEPNEAHAARRDMKIFQKEPIITLLVPRLDRPFEEDLRASPCTLRVRESAIAEGAPRAASAAAVTEIDSHWLSELHSSLAAASGGRRLGHRFVTPFLAMVVDRSGAQKMHRSRG